jgi:hypothetical protein
VRNTLPAVQALRDGEERTDVFSITTIDGTSREVPVVIRGVADVVSGVVADGYLAGATVFADLNRNRALDAGEGFTLTDSNGAFSLDFGDVVAPLVSIGGTDISTGLPFTGSLLAPAGASVINPLTTLVAAVMNAEFGVDAPADVGILRTARDAANARVVAGLGLPAVDLTVVDPLSPQVEPVAALAIQKVAASIGNMIVVARSLNVDAGAAMRNLADAVVAASAAAPVNLASESLALRVLTAPRVGTTTPVIPAPAALAMLVDTNAKIATAASISGVALLQTTVQSANGFIQENEPAGTPVYQANVPALMTAPTFSLKDGLGDDRSHVTIDSATGAARLVAVADYETKSSYRFTVVASQSGQAAVETSVSIRVTNVNESPTGLALAGTSVAENVPVGTTVGTLSTLDPDVDDTFSYALVSGEGGEDNDAFIVEGNVLKTARRFNHEVRASYNIRVRVADVGGASAVATFTVAIANVVDEVLVVEDVRGPAAGTYGLGQRTRFTIVLSEVVQVRGRPSLELLLGSSRRIATYVFANGSGIAAAGEKLGAVLPAFVAGQPVAGVRFDAAPPAVSGRVALPAAGSYAAGGALDFVVRFFEPVTVGGVPQISIAGLRQPRSAVYVAGSGTTELTFRYVVQAGDASRGSKPASLATQISLPSGAVIADSAGNRAVLKLPATSLKGIRFAQLGGTAAPTDGVRRTVATARPAKAAAFAAYG